jgi:type VI secretion system secreted protein Hcp
MALNALMKISNAKGETKQDGVYSQEGWIELQGWDWDVEAETSWTKGGGASVGKPNPGKMNWEHYFDTSSTAVLRNIFSGQAFDNITLHMLKGTGTSKGQQCYFQMIMSGAFITKVSQSATDEGNVVQKVEMVFKDVHFIYHPQIDKGPQAGTLGAKFEVKWDIPAGKVS